MPSSRFRLAGLLLRQEVRALLGFPSLWITLVILSLLVGYSFVHAVDLFSQASRTALAYPELAGGMNPVQGVFVPTFGACYLVETLLLPFVAIRLVGQEKQTGTLKLLLQLPLSPTVLNATKLAALGLAGGLLAIPSAAAVALWLGLGGDLYLPELATLLLGHALYTLTIFCIAMFAAAVTETPASAAIIALTVTLGSWVLDFAAGNGGGLETLSAVSLTTLLRRFESGLLSSTAVAAFLAISLLFFLAASIFLHPGRRPAAQWVATGAVAGVVAVVVWGAVQWPLYLDATEDHRHSFNPADERALKAMPAPLAITVHLNRDDSRLYDLEQTVLSKLRRLVPRLRIVYAESAAQGLFGAPENDQYGLIEFDYRGRHDQTYSTSPREILPLIHALAGQRVSPDPVPAYAGHPLVAGGTAGQWLFYLGLPLLFLFGAGFFRYPKPFQRLFTRYEP